MSAKLIKLKEILDINENGRHVEIIMMDVFDPRFKMASHGITNVCDKHLQVT